MNRFVLASLLLVLISVIACKQEAPPGTVNHEMPVPTLPATDGSTEVSPPKPPATEQNIKINSFSEFPAGIDGCSCYFAESKRKLEAGEYIYVDDSEDTAYMLIKEEMVQFDLTEAAANGENAILKNGTSSGPLSLTLSLKELGQIDETRQYSGTITVKYDTGEAVFQLLYGECGC